jgi:hypothetical protein
MFQKSHHSKQTAAIDLRARIVVSSGVTANHCSANYVDHVGHHYIWGWPVRALPSFVLVNPESCRRQLKRQPNRR